jgi:hypothetical protein
MKSKCEWGECDALSVTEVLYPARCGSGRCWLNGAEICHLCNNCAVEAAREIFVKYPTRAECESLLFCDRVCC